MTFDNYVSEIVDKIYDDISHIGIGVGANPLEAADTLLDDETLRKVATKTVDGNTVIFEGYWDETEGNGATYTEAGVFWNGDTGDIDTGVLAFGGQINVPKDNTQTLTVSVEVTVEGV